MTMCSVCNFKHNFLSDLASAFVCPACRSVLYKDVTYTDNQPEEAYRIIEDMSLFQIGSQLKFNGVDYHFVGRYQFWMSQFLRNLWILHATNHEPLFVIENNGFLAICTQHKTSIRTGSLSLTVNHTNHIAGLNAPVYLETKFVNEITRAEGEVWLLNEFKQKFNAFDFSNNNGDVLFGFEFSRNPNLMLFTGQAVSFHEHQFLNTRLANGN